MLDDLSKTLRAILADPEVPSPLSDADVAFERPGDAFSPGKATVNLFLYDVREQVELRSNETVTERRDGIVTFRTSPIRLACSYQVTAWADPGATGEQAVFEQQRLLGAALGVFARMPRVGDRYLQGSLVDPIYPVALASAQADLVRNSAEFWTAMGGKLRPSFTLTATIALDPDGKPVTAHEVTTKQIALHGTEPIFQVAGTVRAAGNAGLLDAVELTLDGLGLQARSDAMGRYTFAGVPEGTYPLQARKSGYRTATRQVQVPGSSPTAFDLRLTPL